MLVFSLLLFVFAVHSATAIRMNFEKELDDIKDMNPEDIVEKLIGKNKHLKDIQFDKNKGSISLHMGLLAGPLVISLHECAAMLKLFPGHDMMTMLPLSAVPLQEQGYLAVKDTLYSGADPALLAGDNVIRFRLYTGDQTRNNGAPTSDLSNLTDLCRNINKNIVRRPTKILLHGWTQSGIEPWILDMKNRFLVRYPRCNVIIVDWREGSMTLYPYARRNTEIVGTRMAELMQILDETYGFRKEDFHVVGHSLGGQTSGYCGARYRGIYRITAVDPAGPMYWFDTPPHRLDLTDAAFVDVIHTNTGVLGNTRNKFSFGCGIKVDSGHMDFYVNGGANQPGCSTEEYGKIDFLMACSHFRSFELFTASINTTLPFFAHMCESYEEYVQGKCKQCANGTGACAMMGLYADQYFIPSPGNIDFPLNQKIYYVMTTSDIETAFAAYYYSVRIITSPYCSTLDKSVLEATFLVGNTQVKARIPYQNETADFSASSEFNFLMQTNKLLGDVKSFNLRRVEPTCGADQLKIEKIFFEPLDYRTSTWNSSRLFRPVHCVFDSIVTCLAPTRFVALSSSGGGSDSGSGGTSGTTSGPKRTTKKGRRG